MRENNRFTIPESPAQSVRLPRDFVADFGDKTIGCFLQAVIVEMKIGLADLERIEARYRGLCALHGVDPSL